MKGSERPFPDSLCHGCRYLQLVAGKRSQFLLCGEPSLPKYSPQPVHSCPGYQPGS